MYIYYSSCMYLGVDNIQDKTKQGLYSGIFLSKMAERERPFSQNNGSLLSIAFSWSPERIVERGTESKMWCVKFYGMSLLYKVLYMQISSKQVLHFDFEVKY